MSLDHRCGEQQVLDARRVDHRQALGQPPADETRALSAGGSGRGPGRRRRCRAPSVTCLIVISCAGRPSPRCRLPVSTSSGTPPCTRTEATASSPLSSSGADDRVVVTGTLPVKDEAVHPGDLGLRRVAEVLRMLLHRRCSDVYLGPLSRGHPCHRWEAAGPVADDVSHPVREHALQRPQACRRGHPADDWSVAGDVGAARFRGVYPTISSPITPSRRFPSGTGSRRRPGTSRID